MTNKKEKKEKNFDASGTIMGIFTILTIGFLILESLILQKGIHKFIHLFKIF